MDANYHLASSWLIWRAAGCPAAEWPLEPSPGKCGTCHIVVTERASHPLGDPKVTTQSCPACAWMYTQPKQKNRAVLALGNNLFWPLIKADPAQPHRPQWSEMFQRVADADLLTPTTGVLTTDPKPRLWTKTHVSTAGAFGLFLNTPEYNAGFWVSFSARRALDIGQTIGEALALGFSKRTIARDLGRHKSFEKAPAIAYALESDLRGLRRDPAFLPALIATSREETASE